MKEANRWLEQAVRRSSEGAEGNIKTAWVIYSENILNKSHWTPPIRKPIGREQIEPNRIQNMEYRID